MAKTGIFKVWLVGAVSPTSRYFEYGSYGEGAMYAIGMRVKSLFDQVCQHANSPFTAADYSWEMDNVADTDVVVYCLGRRDNSILAKKNSSPIHNSASGGTGLFNNQMISEVYMTAFDGAANYSTLAANIIFHEIMHNKLDAPALKTINDLHLSGGDGLALPVVSAASGLTPRNIELINGRRARKKSSAIHGGNAETIVGYRIITA